MSDHDSRSILSAPLIGSLLIGLGLLGAGWFAAQGMARLKTADRYVTVKGSAEKIVDADLVVWPLPHTVGGKAVLSSLPGLSRLTRASGSA